MELVVQTGVHVPFLARGNAPHTMQLVQYRLKTCQDRTIQLDRERAFQTRLVLRLLEQILELEEFDLQMQLPIQSKSGDTNITTQTETVVVHRHELLDRVVQPSRKQGRLFVGMIISHLSAVHLVLSKRRVRRDETRVQPTDIQTEPVKNRGYKGQEQEGEKKGLGRTLPAACSIHAGPRTATKTARRNRPKARRR